MKDTIIIDLDGTLSDPSHRLHYLDKGDWDSFYAACGGDSPHQEIVALANLAHNAGLNVMIVSARRKSETQQTIAWLRDNGVKYSMLSLLRGDNDYTPDQKLKEEWLMGIDKSYVLFVVDDRQRVVDMWRKNGLVCLQCRAWEEK